MALSSNANTMPFLGKELEHLWILTFGAEMLILSRWILRWPHIPGSQLAEHLWDSSLCPTQLLLWSLGLCGFSDTLRLFLYEPCGAGGGTLEFFLGLAVWLIAHSFSESRVNRSRPSLQHQGLARHQDEPLGCEDIEGGWTQLSLISFKTRCHLGLSRALLRVSCPNRPCRGKTKGRTKTKQSSCLTPQVSAFASRLHLLSAPCLLQAGASWI